MSRFEDTLTHAMGEVHPGQTSIYDKQNYEKVPLSLMESWLKVREIPGDPDRSRFLKKGWTPDWQGEISLALETLPVAIAEAGHRPAELLEADSKIRQAEKYRDEALASGQAIDK